MRNSENIGHILLETVRQLVLILIAQNISIFFGWEDDRILIALYSRPQYCNLLQKNIGILWLEKIIVHLLKIN